MILNLVSINLLIHWMVQQRVSDFYRWLDGIDNLLTAQSLLLVQCLLEEEG